MARLLQSWRRVLGLPPSAPRPSHPSPSPPSPSPATSPTPPAFFPRSIDADFSIFREGDRAILHGKNPILTKPLRHGHKTDLRRGSLPHDNIIGRRVRDRIPAHKGPDCRLTQPTLDEYVALTPRLVTPIYAADANLIVSLLDIHVAPPTTADSNTPPPPPLEILESGTGHGSLTLHLARAIQAANSTPPPLPSASQVQYLQDRPTRPDEETSSSPSATDPNPETTTPEPSESDLQETYNTWRKTRNAIIHTVDVSAKFSTHAEKTIRGFRRGLYAPHIDFYIGPVEHWISAQRTLRQEPEKNADSDAEVTPFLTHAILDMPGAHLRIPAVAPILKRDGVLAVFMPSITQIGDCVDLIRREGLPFTLDRVVELGAGISSGRLWDVRFAVKKSRADPSSWNTSSASATEDAEYATPADATAESPVSETDSAAEIPAEAPKKNEDGVLVCRPKVGSRIVGGGFVGIWRRIE